MFETSVGFSQTRIEWTKAHWLQSPAVLIPATLTNSRLPIEFLRIASL